MSMKMQKKLAQRNSLSFLFFLIISFYFSVWVNDFSLFAADNKAITPDDVYRTVTGNKPYDVSGQKASFIKNNEKWFIIGAHKPINRNYLETKEWPLKGPVYDIVILSDPISDDKILPKIPVMKNVLKSGVIKLEACRGEYEPVSFVIRTGDIQLKDVEITSTHLKRINRVKNGRPETIDNKFVDIRIVKSWYQSGESLRTDKHGVSAPEPELLVANKTLTPELLLHNDKLIDIDHTYQVNVIRDFTNINDKEKIEPFDCEIRSNKQIWITLKIPNNSKPGEYEGTIHIKPKNTNKTNIKLSLTVFPFELKPPKLYYALYYLNALQLSKNQNLFDFKPKSSMYKDFLDIKSHGINNVIISQRNLNLDVLEDVLNLKDSAGLDKDSLFFTAWPKLVTDHSSLKKLTMDVETLVGFTRKRNIRKVYYYGVDELKTSLLPLERAMLKTIRQSGGLTMTATDQSFLGVIDDLLDLVIFRGPPDQRIVEAVHKKNNQIWIYGNPQGGEEKPLTYRYNYGYLLWKLKVDGAGIYAYQGRMGQDPWDDFDHPKYRDHMMTYPTIDGVIPTIQWEGLREGIDDVRYLSTLIDLENNLDDSKKREIQEAIANLDFSQPPKSIRQEIVRKILYFINQ
ncbi:MAG: hypothetical protein C0399_08610 [Syntrophus sp. (in: bacteria)]|nr:hypothetical protein [Syntrophus sp. (in: bacteria)]